MLQFTTGDILGSGAQCLVNTVNCEGFMGKGIAYQFKLRFPENNQDYIKACRSGDLRIGTLHYFRENGKIIVNFPTKNKWREKSHIDYIHKGLSELVQLIPRLNISSIAVPPLGCGNGGLNWAEVKPIICSYLEPLTTLIDVIIYEPSSYPQIKSATAPKMNLSHLILMGLKLKLEKFTRLRLQKTAYFTNLFYGSDYFKFDSYKFGPYAHSIDILTKDIQEFQHFYNLDTSEAFNLAKNITTSKVIDQKLVEFTFAMEKAAELVNRIKTDKELELLATVCFILGAKIDLTLDDILQAITAWSQEKANKFTPQSVQRAISFLINENLIYINLMGYYNLAIPPNQVKTNTLVKYQTFNINGSLNFKGRDF
ncbi:MAG: macro domain-containing protein [Clostridia bacterium]|nr:macro domain-containing protein [Clostridia bacterium]